MNKIRISKFQEEKLLQKLEKYNYNRDDMMKHYTKYKLEGCLYEDSPTSEFLSIFENLDLHELVLVISGFYEVYLNKEDIVLQKYKENKKICYDTYNEKELMLYKGFNKGIEFVNEVYGLKIKFNDEKGNE